MSEQNESLVRAAYEAYGRGDLAGLLDIIDPDLEWTYLDPSFADPEPQTCHGRDELRCALQRQAEQGLRSEVTELASSGDKVMVVIRTPGIDRHRVRPPGDRNFLVLTLRQGRVVAMRACRDGAEARAAAGLE
jgi:ketosteroid isomerase-like protein